MKKDLDILILPYYPDLIPGINQVVLIRFSTYSERIQGYILQKEEDRYSTNPLSIKSGTSFFTEIVRNPNSFRWLAKNQLPFEIKDQNKVQLTIFNELNNSILLLTFPIDEQTHHIHFIYFHENLSNFVLDKVSEPFSAQHKGMVGHLIYHSISTIYKVLEEKLQITAALNHQIQTIVSERAGLKESLQKSQLKSRSDKIKLIDYSLIQLGKEYGKQFSLTEAARVKLLDYQGDITHLSEMLREAVTLAALVYSGGISSSSVIIADYHISFPKSEETRLPAEVSDKLPQRMIKTHLLLDRLEHAAAGLKERRIAMTSSNVGREFPSPISAPAITDALRKHKVRIIDLFRQFPEKWEVIRHEFKPIQNLLEGESNQDSIPA